MVGGGGFSPLLSRSGRNRRQPLFQVITWTEAHHTAVGIFLCATLLGMAGRPASSGTQFKGAKLAEGDGIADGQVPAHRLHE